MAESRKLFTDRALWYLILPLIVEQTLAITVGFFDTVMVSSLGDPAVAGVSLVDMINNLIISIFAALGTGGAVVASQFLGAKHPEEAQRSALQLIVAALAVSLVIMGVCLALTRPIIVLFFGKIEADVMRACLDYFFLTAFSFPFIAVYNACAALFRAMRNSKIPMLVSLLSNVLNLGGNALLIYGVPWGVSGAAISTVFARFVAMAILLIILTRKTRPIYLEINRRSRIDFAMMKRILGIGIPSGVENSLFQLGRVVVVAFISGYGTAQIAANAAANNLDGIGVIIGNSMQLAMITVIGQCVGAGSEVQMKYYLKKLMLWTYLMHGAFNLLLLALLPVMLNLYDLSIEATSLARILVIIHYLCGIVLWPVAFVFPNALRACNDVKYTMTVSVLSMAIFRISLSYLLGTTLGYGAIGIWIAMVVDWVVRCAFFLGRYRSGAWKGHAHF